MKTRPTDPEPCDTCDLGVLYIVCFDGLRRCRNCVHDLAAANGWDEMPPPPEPLPAPVPDGPPDMPMSPVMKRALREEKKARNPQLDLVSHKRTR